jgi:hypothetical protein
MNQASKSDAPNQQRNQTTNAPSKLRVKTGVKGGRKAPAEFDG